jgi:DEAD/DEAH box helicase domain-containing protein
VPGTVYFDLETQRSFGDVGGSAHKDKMGMSVGVTYSTENGQYHIFNEENVADLVEQLIKADLVVGYNHVQFDYPVLQAYTIYDWRPRP